MLISRNFCLIHPISQPAFQAIDHALLSPDKQYTVEAVEQMIEKYMKGQVK